MMSGLVTVVALGDGRFAEDRVDEFLLRHGGSQECCASKKFRAGQPMPSCILAGREA